MTVRPQELRVWLAGEWLVISTNEGASHVVRWVLLETASERVRVLWPADVPEVRAHQDEWLLFDARGRLLNFNTKTSQQQSFSLR
jgi:hypothetical protein